MVKERTEAGLPFFQMRSGIHTGPVVTGIVGVKKFQYDIWGDTVNTAARMENAGSVGKVNISESTYLLTKDNSDFQFKSRKSIEVKGKGNLPMWFVEKA
jgi:class 3 adenylate cyclase